MKQLKQSSRDILGDIKWSISIADDIFDQCVQEAIQKAEAKKRFCDSKVYHYFRCFYRELFAVCPKRMKSTETYCKPILGHYYKINF